MSTLLDQPRLAPERIQFLGVSFDCLNQSEVVAQLQARHSNHALRYVVTPNVDHIVRLAAQPALLATYQQAWLCLCDSKPIEVLSKTVGSSLTHVTGSDLTKAIFNNVLVAGDVVTLIVAQDEVANKMAAKYPHLSFNVHVPPFDILNRPDDLQTVVNFIVDHPARFTFVAIGSPQSEIIVSRASDAKAARGTALCVGASLEFITGDRVRAPGWMNRSGIEWMHRVATEPRRLWRRYLFAIPPLAKLYWRELTARLLR